MLFTWNPNYLAGKRSADVAPVPPHCRTHAAATGHKGEVAAK